MKKTAEGQILPIVMVSLVLLTLIIFGLVSWIQNDAKWAIKEQESTTAINFAEAGIDRGTWKLQSTTSTWATAFAGLPIPGGGYAFDKTYTDIPGGSYRINFITGPATGSCSSGDCVTVVAEGRDNSTGEVRAVSAVFRNQTIYSAMMSGGNVTWAKGLIAFWGPIIAQGNISLADDFVGAWYFPRKFAKGVVTGPPSGNYPRDTNGLVPPNTDNVEWWSEYTGVPNVPILDFVTLRSSAAATGTLNIYGCKNSFYHGASTGTIDQGGTAGAATWDLRTSCALSAGDATSHNQHFGDSTAYVKNVLGDTTFSNDYVWYWDNDVTFVGLDDCGGHPCTPTGHSTSLRGTVVVRGNLTIDSFGDFKYSGHVPVNAWQEENKLTKTTFDTAATGEYPGDNGFHTTVSTFNFGTDTFNIPLAGSGFWTTVGVRGLTYVGGNLNIVSYMDFNGAVWVNGNVTASGGSNTAFCGIFYNDTLSVPALNVILLRESWQEVAPSNTAWN